MIPVGQYKILLINSLYKSKNKETIYPVGLYYLSLFLKKHFPDHYLQIFDMNLSKNPYQDLERILSKYNFQITAISYRNLIRHSFLSKLATKTIDFEKVTRICKQIRPDMKIIIGGPAFAIDPEKVLKRFGNIDYGLVDNVGGMFAELIESNFNDHSVKNVYYRNKDQIIFSGYRSDDSFENAITGFTVFPGLNAGDYDEIGIQTKKGCIFQCKHCPQKYLEGNKIRLRSVKTVIDEISFYLEMGVRNFYFTDSVFNYPNHYCMDLLQEIINKSLNISWSAFLKASYIDDDLAVLLLKSGCRKIDISAESGDDNILRYLNTNETVDSIINAAEILKNYPAIRICYYFLLGTEKENFSSLIKTMKLALRLRMKYKSEIYFSTFNPINKTEVNVKCHNFIINTLSACISVFNQLI
ncbi:MAG: radical SAM protein [Candidatus Aureabacteria bacterium]|nr:radical SAM protein [Candidatus Auribacterota bacterium]